MPLYGHELSEDIDPITAGLGFAVKLDKGAEFPGRAALAATKANPSRKRRVGVELATRRIAREGTPVVANGAAVGLVTSGTFSPTLEKSIAMALVDATVGPVGSSVSSTFVVPSNRHRRETPLLQAPEVTSPRRGCACFENPKRKRGTPLSPQVKISPESTVPFTLRGPAPRSTDHRTSLFDYPQPFSPTFDSARYQPVPLWGEGARRADEGGPISTVFASVIAFFRVSSVFHPWRNLLFLALPRKP